MRIDDVHLEATRSVLHEMSVGRRLLRTIAMFWAVFWSMFGPLSFLMWCSFAYHWFR